MVFARMAHPLMPSSRKWQITIHLASSLSMHALVALCILEVRTVLNEIVVVPNFELNPHPLVHLETLVVSMWKVDETADQETIHFITKVKDRDAVVIKDGTVTLSKAKIAAKL
jgi:hypothetical protein